MTPTEQDKELRYHLGSCEMYENLRGIFPNDRRLTGKSCSCGLKEFITADRKRVALEARIDELSNAQDELFKGAKMTWFTNRRVELKAQQEEV